MECDICLRPHSSKLSLYCPSCVRTALYKPRLRNAEVLLEKEQIANQIDRITSAQGIETYPRSLDFKKDEGINRQWLVESHDIKRAQAKERTDDIHEHAQSLRDEIKAAREEIARRKAVMQTKKAEVETNRKAVTARWNNESETLRADIKKISQLWDNEHHKGIETRSFLCREAAHLYGLKQRKKSRGGVVREQYIIGGLPVIDLRDINNAKANELTTSLTNTAHLVVLVAFYLSIRLPAEITLPHRNYPLPTILTPANSYQGQEIPFPGMTPASSSTNSPVGSRHTDLRHLPRPRPLFIEPENLKDKISIVAKKDPATFSFFLEGISLLAWDIAWLCRSQGMYTGTESWEDVCNMGQNLWNLLIAPPQPAALLRVLSGDMRQQQQQQQRTQRNSNNNNNNSSSTPPQRTLRLGHFSHDSAHTFPSGSSSGSTDFLRGWKLTKYTMIVDPLKRALISEMSNAEWEVLEQEEWDDGGEQFRDDEAVFVGSRNLEARGGAFEDRRSLSVMTAGRRSLDRANSDEVGDFGVGKGEGENGAIADVGGGNGSSSPRVKGTSGWTKLKNREK